MPRPPRPPPPPDLAPPPAAGAAPAPSAAPAPPLNAVGATVRRLRVARGLTQEALAAKLQLTGWDCTRSWLAKVESGQVLVRDHQLLHLRAVLRVPLDDLFPTLDPRRARRRA